MVKSWDGTNHHEVFARLALMDAVLAYCRCAQQRTIHLPTDIAASMQTLDLLVLQGQLSKSTEAQSIESMNRKGRITRDFDKPGR